MSKPGANLIETMSDSEILATLRRKTAANSVALNQRREEFKKTVAIQVRCLRAIIR